MSTTQDDRRIEAGDTDNARFAISLRGYDRHQVDEFVTRQSRVERELRTALTEAEGKLRQETENAESEIGRLRAELATGRPADGFGSRAEKLLRLAESEASEMRASASRESIALIERARVDAEQHRHESEQAIIARTRELEQDSRRRAAELADREEKAAEQIASGRAEADRLRVAAADAAATERSEATAEAERITAKARAEADRIREEARQERERVTKLRGQVHNELERITSLIREQLKSGDTPS